MQCLSYANLDRITALGRADRRNVDPIDSEVVELHRSSLFDRERYVGVGANVIQRGQESRDQRTRGSRKGGGAYVELGCHISGYRVDRRCIRP